MKLLQGRGLIGGRVRGPALVTRMPVNFTASLTKIGNMVPGRESEVQDRHHDLYRALLRDRIVVFPACIGSTYTGMVLLELVRSGNAPRALIVQAADPLLVSAPVLALVWFDVSLPLVEYPDEDLFQLIRTGDMVEVDGTTGRIAVF